MSLRALIFLLVIIFALFAVLAKVEINPWWGILAVAIACLVGDYIGDRRL